MMAGKARADKFVWQPEDIELDEGGSLPKGEPAVNRTAAPVPVKKVPPKKDTAPKR